MSASQQGGHESGGENEEAARILSAAFGVLARHWSLPEAEIGGLEPGFTPVAALFADERFIEAMLARQQAATPGLDAKGAAAFFISEYANLLGIVAAVPLLSHGLVPNLAPDNCALALSLSPGAAPRVRLRFLRPAGATDRLRPQTAAALLRAVGHEGLRAALAEGLEAHMAPLIHRLQSRTGLPWQAMWRLVADAVAARFLEAGRQLGCEAAAKEEAMAVLKRPGSPLANRQLHFFDIVIREDRPSRRVLARRSFRARGGCCRFYTAPNGSLCSTCVLVEPDERRHRIEAHMRAELGLPELPEPPAAAAGRVPVPETKVRSGEKP